MSGSGGIGMGVRLRRSLLSIAVAYAVAIQSLVIAVGGLSLPPDPGQGAAAFELCLHDTSGAADLPAGKPDLPGCTHCIFCFAGAHHAVIGAAPAAFHRVDAAVLVVRLADGASASRRPTRHAIANPRGPPSSA
jgi:hypothetical protein